MFLGKSRAKEPLLAGDDEDQKKVDAKHPNFEEDENLTTLRRTIRLNYTKYSLAEDKEKREQALARLT